MNLGVILVAILFTQSLLSEGSSTPGTGVTVVSETDTGLLSQFRISWEERQITHKMSIATVRYHIYKLQKPEIAQQVP